MAKGIKTRSFSFTKFKLLHFSSAQLVQLLVNNRASTNLEGNTFEGKTLLPVLAGIEQKYGFGKPVVLADAAMLSNENIQSLEQGQFPFIVGARIRNETQAMQEDILRKCSQLHNGQSVVIEKDSTHRLIVSYSDKRARKDAHNRKRGLKKLRNRVNSGKLTKDNLNNRGYNKFLRLAGEVKIEIDEEKIAQAARWDGLKGYLTNTDYSPEAGNRDVRSTMACGKGFSSLQDRPSDPSNASLSQETD